MLECGLPSSPWFPPGPAGAQLPLQLGPRAAGVSTKVEERLLEIYSRGAFWVHSADGCLSSGLALLFPQMHRAMA